MFGFLKNRRREKFRVQSFPTGWTEILKGNVPYYSSLSDEEREKLHRDILVFVTEKRFEGCGGLEITDEIKVTIAAIACVLLLHLDHDYYPRLKSILVYPQEYVANTIRWGPGGQLIEASQSRLGESWHHGAVVLSWDAVQHSAADIRDGHNVVLHEFAHQLDQENGSADGAPILPKTCNYGTWARVLGREYKVLSEQVAHYQRTVIDPYGATNPAEFFAVITECFFEKPFQLRANHPELYGELMQYYRQDPAQRLVDDLERMRRDKTEKLPG